MNYLFDTNTVIYFLENKLSLDIKNEDNIDISFINEIELLGKEVKEEESKAIKLFLERVTIIGINDEIKKKTIEIRKAQRLKIPDAIVAATAAVNNEILLTADKEMLKKLDKEWVRNPLK